jgi:7-carboxy-7-deazaguanine synthase
METSHQGTATPGGKDRLLPETLAGLGPDRVLVKETFLSIQGESTRAGRPCFFIRLAGCHLRCSWCDTTYAYEGGEVLSVGDCVRRAREASVPLVEVTGGEPLLQRGTLRLLADLAGTGLEVLLETSGALPIGDVDPRVVRIVDVKCPGSGMEGRNQPGIERDLRSRDELKFVIADRADYLWAKAWIEGRRDALPAGIPVHFSPVFERCRADELAAWILEDRLDVRLGLQIHKVIWGARKGV